MSVDHMGHFTAIGMRTKVEEPDALVINTCAGNDTAGVGDPTHWVWCNPTNRMLVHEYEDIEAYSVECLWQGTKILPGADGPDPLTLRGDWRRGKGKRPLGAYAGPGRPLITSPGEARRRIYLPAYRHQVELALQMPEPAGHLRAAREHNGPVYLRDFDTGRGLDRNGPMSHAWVLAAWLNTGRWPDEVTR